MNCKILIESDYQLILLVNEESILQIQHSCLCSEARLYYPRIRQFSTIIIGISN